MERLNDVVNVEGQKLCIKTNLLSLYISHQTISIYIKYARINKDFPFLLIMLKN